MNVPLEQKKHKDNKMVTDKESKEEGRGGEGGRGVALGNCKESG